MFRRLFEYEYWADREALASLAALAGSANGAGDRALRFFNHIIGANRVWLDRLEQRGASAAQPWPTLTLEECPEAFNFFRDLAQNNSKPWFDQNRQRNDQHVAGAFRGLLDSLEPFLLKLNPQLETAGKTNRNFSRINRDIRFSKDKSPYKPNYYLYVFDGRHDRGHAGRLYVGLSADCLTVGFSIYATDRKSKGALDTIFRKRLQTHREVFERLLREIVRGRRYETYWHRMEKNDWAQHSG